jgi:recombination protein RecA
LNGVNRLPTGIPPLDMILGSGIPENRVTESFGLPNSLQINSGNAHRGEQKAHLPRAKMHLDCVRTVRSEWASKFGVDVKKLLVIHPNYAEQVIDVCGKLMDADDCGLVVLDNLAAMATKKELENPAAIGDPGGSGKVNKKLFNTVMEAQRKAAKKVRESTFVFTNQMRRKFGAAGSELTSFGGPFPKHAAALRLRLYAKDVMDKSVHTGLPARKEVRAVVEKPKIPVASGECTFEIALLNHAGLKIGQIKSNWVLPPQPSG